MGDTYRFVGENHYHDGDRLDRGDIVELTEHEADQFAHKFEPVDDGQSEPTDDGSADAETATEPEDDASGDDETDPDDGPRLDPGGATEVRSREENDPVERLRNVEGTRESESDDA